MQSKSIIIPIGKGDGSWVQLLPQLTKIKEVEIILVFSEKPPKLPCLNIDIKTVEGPGSRHGNLNAGANVAKKKSLLFLHADSVLSTDFIQKLNTHSFRNNIYFGQLEFKDHSSFKARLTETGAFIRSELWNLPFGDQAILLPKHLWKTVGPFPSIPEGEDHLFMWKAKDLVLLW